MPELRRRKLRGWGCRELCGESFVLGRFRVEINHPLPQVVLTLAALSALDRRRRA